MARCFLDAVGASGQQITELNGSGQWQHSNVYAAGGRLIATYTPNSNTYHYNLTDWLGTKRMQTTAVGTSEETCTSYPFGDGLTCTGSANATEQHFTGKDRDDETGLDYFGARYLSSNFGRFITPDWAASPTSVPYAQFGDPQSLNLYAYVGNNPNTNIDMDGHEQPAQPQANHNGGYPIYEGGNYCADFAFCWDLPDGYSGGGLNWNAAVNYLNSLPTPYGDDSAQQQSSSDAKTAKINSRAQSQYNNDVPIIAKQLGVSADEVRDSVHIDYDVNGRAVVVGGHVNMTVDDGSDAQSALAARLGPGPHGYNENAATGQGQGSEFSRLGTSPSVHLDGGLLHVDRFNASAWGGLGVVPHFFYDVAYGHMQGSSNPMLPY